MRTLCNPVAAILFLGLITSTLCQRACAVDFYEQTVLNDSPLTYWRLGEASTASPAVNLGTQGAGSNGTYGSTTTMGATGALFNSTNKAAGFTAGSTTSFARKTAFAFPTGSFSSEIWVKTPTQNTTQGLISYNSNSANGENDFLLVSQNNNTLQLILSNGTTQATSLNITDNNWHHLVTTWDITTGKLNIFNNGASVFSVNNYRTGIGRTTLGSLILGQEQDGNAGTYTLDANQSLGGNLDEFALYNYVLSPEQVLLHYNVGVGIVLPPVAPEPGSFCLLGLGALALGHARRRRRAIARALGGRREWQGFSMNE